jgi:hypothetical protein
MSKENKIKEFVEKIDATKKVNPKDLSSDQDLTIAIMNLISIEEHLMFSGAKTGKSSYYDLIEQVRETRKNLMLKVIPEYEGEVWCISKHLLSASMRLMEVGTKQQSLGHKKEAYKLFDQSYELYCLFWGLNMKLLNLEDVKWIEDSFDDVKKLTKELTQPVEVAEEKNEEVKEEVTASGEKNTFSKIKAFVRKAVDCCIE